ncbi:hypothetical protein N3K66_005601 [Trichothecium roseum]|uniref:Uncharacterized protein n=1 Tax=Trichothecium roseum TaxID=47278 RepID=A0ACC0UZ18_9HYPO|nr:hypothetical protein N3K66_005601 [Trichothecium roseum]
MERTESGLSISSADLTDDNTNDSEPASNFLSDHAAALLVERHMLQYRRRCHNSQHERILKALVTPRARGADFPLDDEALRSIFSAANELFFAGKLSRRVEWDWSTNCSDGGEEGRYAGHVVGTTAIRRNRRWGGYEALIVLSSPILRDDRYNRRLLIATFLHEMIHSFLFVVCGVKARLCGGHTEGFKRIAELIDGWIGKECLRLGDMEADLEWFSKEKKEDLAVPPEMGRVVASSRPGWSAEDESFIGPRSHNFEQRRNNFDGWQWYGQEGFSTGRQLVEGQYVYPPMQ